MGKTRTSRSITSPRRILLHHPRHGNSLETLSADRLKELNFLALPHPGDLYAEYDAFTALLGAHVEPVFLDDVLGADESYRDEAASNPNLIFMRDSSVTLPWEPRASFPRVPRCRAE